jgi:NitT/TauT family transport system ATP-binding protein
MKKTVLEIKNLNHWFGSNLVLHNVNLEINRGNIVSIVGPSGCGKSTLFRAIVGTHPPCSGEVLVHTGATEVRSVTAPGRDRGIVYQRYSLYPFLTALENVALAPKLDQTSIPYRLINWFGWKKKQKAHLEEARLLLEKVGLKGAENRYPTEMSGGMCQRVAIAQALIMKPEILLLDEPFGALDEATREDLQKMLLNFKDENKLAEKAGEKQPYTILLVTHELNEAIYVGDRVVGLSQYWNWKKEGHVSCPGATIVYDVAAPEFDSNQEKDYAAFEEQKREIRQFVFAHDVLQDALLYRKYGVEVK